MRLSRKQLNSDIKDGKVPKFDPNGEPHREPVPVRTDDPNGFGSRTVRAENPDGTNMKDANGDFVPQKACAAQVRKGSLRIRPEHRQLGTRYIFPGVDRI